MMLEFLLAYLGIVNGSGLGKIIFKDSYFFFAFMLGISSF